MKHHFRDNKTTWILGGIAVGVVVLTVAILTQLQASGVLALRKQGADASWWRPQTSGCASITNPFKRAACLRNSTPSGSITPDPENPGNQTIDTYGSFTLKQNNTPLSANGFYGTVDIKIKTEFDANGTTYFGDYSTTVTPTSASGIWGPVKISTSSQYNSRVSVTASARVLANSQTYNCTGSMPTLIATPSSSVLNFQDLELNCTMYGSNTGQGTRAVDIEGYTTMRQSNGIIGSIPLRTVTGNATITTRMINNGKTIQTSSVANMQISNSQTSPIFNAIAQASIGNQETSASVTVNFYGVSYLDDRTYRCYGTKNFTIPPSVFNNPVHVDVTCTPDSQPLNPERDGRDF